MFSGEGETRQVWHGMALLTWRSSWRPHSADWCRAALDPFAAARLWTCASPLQVSGWLNIIQAPTTTTLKWMHTHPWPAARMWACAPIDHRTAGRRRARSRPCTGAFLPRSWSSTCTYRNGNAGDPRPDTDAPRHPSQICACPGDNRGL